MTSRPGFEIRGLNDRILPTIAIKPLRLKVGNLQVPGNAIGVWRWRGRVSLAGLGCLHDAGPPVSVEKNARSSSYAGKLVAQKKR